MSFSGAQYLEFPAARMVAALVRNYFASSSWMQATATSFKAAALTAFVATPWERWRRMGWPRHVSPCARDPRAAHHADDRAGHPVAIAVFYVFVKMKMNNSLIGLVLAHSMLAVPLVLIVVTSALAQFDANQEMVARSLGASRPRPS
jgi:putative spermidine/putrescine transport system permease protein